MLRSENMAVFTFNQPTFYFVAPTLKFQQQNSQYENIWDNSYLK